MPKLFPQSSCIYLPVFSSNCPSFTHFASFCTKSTCFQFPFWEAKSGRSDEIILKQAVFERFIYRFLVPLTVASLTDVHACAFYKYYELQLYIENESNHPQGAHIEFTKNNIEVLCTDKKNVLYQHLEHKGHDGLTKTPVKNFDGIPFELLDDDYGVQVILVRKHAMACAEVVLFLEPHPVRIDLDEAL